MPKVPRYSFFRASSHFASDVKRRNAARDTRPELVLRGELWKLGLRYRKHAALPGKPDLVFRAAKVVIFCDGDFWHGRNWPRRQALLGRGSNAAYWVAKIQSNVTRDRRTSRTLREQGWIVLRFWESDILKRPAAIAAKIQAVVLQRMRASEKRN